MSRMLSEIQGQQQAISTQQSLCFHGDPIGRVCRQNVIGMPLKLINSSEVCPYPGRVTQDSRLSNYVKVVNRNGLLQASFLHRGSQLEM
jgi:hypothetical protein